LTDTGHGVGVRWTSRTVPRKGKPKPFDRAVAAFDAKAFVNAAASTGAGHLMWAVCGRDFRLCCPNAAVDGLIKGRTSRRDLVMDVADAAAAKGMKLMLGMDLGLREKPWQAVGGAENKTICSVVAELGKRYGKKVIAWWFEDVRGLARTFKPADWAALTAAARTGLADRLVGYNTGMQDYRKLTDSQDYSATWVRRVNSFPKGRRTKLQLPWYAMLDWHVDRHSIFASVRELDNPETAAFDWPPPSVESLSDVYKRYVKCGGTVTFNMLIDQGGQIIGEDLAVLRKVGKQLRQKAGGATK